MIFPKYTKIKSDYTYKTGFMSFITCYLSPWYRNFHLFPGGQEISLVR